MKVVRIILNVDIDFFCSSFIHLFRIKNISRSTTLPHQENSLLKNNGKKVSMYICCLNVLVNKSGSYFIIFS